MLAALIGVSTLAAALISDRFRESGASYGYGESVSLAKSQTGIFHTTPRLYGMRGVTTDWRSPLQRGYDPSMYMHPQLRYRAASYSFGLDSNLGGVRGGVNWTPAMTRAWQDAQRREEAAEGHVFSSVAPPG